MNWLNLILHRLCRAWCLPGAELFLRHFGTSAELSKHCMKGPNCLRSEVSVHLPTRIFAIRNSHFTQQCSLRKMNCIGLYQQTVNCTKHIGLAACLRPWNHYRTSTPHAIAPHCYWNVLKVRRLWQRHGIKALHLDNYRSVLNYTKKQQQSRTQIKHLI